MTPIVSGCECVPAETQQRGHLIVAGAGSSYSLPGSLLLPGSPWGLLRSFALPKRPAPGSSACFVRRTPPGGPHCLHHHPLGCPPFLVPGQGDITSFGCSLRTSNPRQHQTMPREQDPALLKGLMPLFHKGFVEEKQEAPNVIKQMINSSNSIKIFFLCSERNQRNLKDKHIDWKQVSKIYIIDKE